MAARADAIAVSQIISAAFDSDFYRRAYPELVLDSMDPVTHYLVHGWREGRDPAPWFSSKAYLAEYPEVAKSGEEPFTHYLRLGQAQGRTAFASRWGEPYLAAAAARAGRASGWRMDEPLSPVAVAQGRVGQADPAERELVGPSFDAAFYLASNPDVSSVGADPLDHFLMFGWREMRDPSARFSVRDYLEVYPDIEAAGINPFVHYLRTGKAEGRTSRNPLGFRYQIVAKLEPMEDRIARVVRHAASLDVDPPQQLASALTSASGGLRDVHVTFSHDDFTRHLGGVQLCLQREAAALEATGRDHLHFFPAAAWPVVRTAADFGQLGVLLNGDLVGIFYPSTIVEALAGMGGAGRRSFAIHSLLGHAADETADILAALGLSEGFFWLHDFASLCAGFHLMRDDVEDCAAPPPSSPACGICVYGEWRARHTEEHARLFERLNLTVVSPSQPTLDLWRRASDLPACNAVVLPHAVLVDREAPARPPAGRPLRIGYAGMPVAHKGWPIFRDLVLRYSDDPRYSFVHLGVRTPGGMDVEFREVSVSRDDQLAMRDAIAAAELDIVLLWPLCRETFSFAAYEAAAAGAAIVTGPDSGNIAAFVRAGAAGRVVDSEADLFDAMEAGAFADLSRAARAPVLQDLVFSRMTLDLPLSEAAR